VSPRLSLEASGAGLRRGWALWSQWVPQVHVHVSQGRRKVGELHVDRRGTCPVRAFWGLLAAGMLIAFVAVIATRWLRFRLTG